MSAGSELLDPDAIARRLRDESGPPPWDRMSVHRTGRAVQTTIMKEAWDSEGVDPDTGTTALQVYYPDSGLILIDLNP